MSLFESDDQWVAIESRARDVIGAESVPYDPVRIGHFVDRACYNSNLGKDYRPLPQDNYTFVNAILARHLEETDQLEETDGRRRGRIAELAFLLDGLHGVDYADLGRIYKSNLKLVAKDGSYTAWRGAIGRAAKLVAEDIAHPSSSALDEALTPTPSRNSKVYETQASQLPKDPLYLTEPLPELPLVHDLMLRDGVVELYREGRTSTVYAQGMMVLFEEAAPNVEGDSWSAKNKIIHTLQQTAYDLQRRLQYGAYPRRIQQGLENDDAFMLGAAYLTEIISDPQDITVHPERYTDLLKRVASANSDRFGDRDADVRRHVERYLLYCLDKIHPPRETRESQNARVRYQAPA